jgi:hypothetical protein
MVRHDSALSPGRSPRPITAKTWPWRRAPVEGDPERAGLAIGPVVVAQEDRPVGNDSPRSAAALTTTSSSSSASIAGASAHSMSGLPRAFVSSLAPGWPEGR